MIPLLALPILAATLATAEPKIVITSFVPVDSRVTWQLAEVCGNLSGLPAARYTLDVISDYRLRSPAHYTVTTGENGKFCTIIRTLTGTVEITMKSSDPELTATKSLR